MSKLIPQPQPTFLIGNLKEIDSSHGLESLKRLHKLYGDIYRLTFFNKSFVVVCSQEIVNFVCDETKFDKNVSQALEELRAVAGDGLFTAHTSEPNWKLAHKILMPAFGPQTIRDMFPAMMDICTQLILRWERFAGEEIDVCDNLTRLTLDTIALCSFNYRFNSFYHNTMHRFVDAMINVLIESGKRVGRFSLQNTLMMTTARRYKNDIEYLHNLCDEIVKERREHPNNVNDLLNRMINGKDPETGYQLSDENIRYQMFTFLVAGHETTSGLLSFTLYYLLKNPHALQKAQAEVDLYNEITVDTLSKLKYIDAVLKETLRLQPTAPGFSLESKIGDIMLPGGYIVDKDDMILVLLSGLHRDPKWSKLAAIEVKSTFSRQNTDDKKYVQDLLWEDRHEIAKLYSNGARFYTCGSANKLGTSVKTCFIKIIAEITQCNEVEAGKILEEISLDRYSVDVFT
ncbi:unnamed protein product [Adineta steineri]|uniref:Cytochrome P450 n=1 Tax=Adineta steineri TaxID=433720 RepID=A0A813QH35_9BILA|nr:unnamed protein product [Adineta steineri]